MRLSSSRQGESQTGWKDVVQARAVDAHQQYGAGRPHEGQAYRLPRRQRLPRTQCTLEKLARVRV